MNSRMGATRRVIASKSRRTCFQQRVRRQQYSTAKGAASSSIPWILSAVAITAGGIWFTLGSPNPTKPHSSPSPNHKSEENKPPSLEEEKKQKAHKKFMDSMAADAPKPEHGGSSVDNHGKAAENNMHKVRTGKFSGKEFDNHISKHSANPGKDFECIEEEKKEEDGKSK